MCYTPQVRNQNWLIARVVCLPKRLGRPIVICLRSAADWYDKDPWRNDIQINHAVEIVTRHKLFIVLLQSVLLAIECPWVHASVGWEDISAKKLYSECELSAYPSIIWPLLIPAHFVPSKVVIPGSIEKTSNPLHMVPWCVSRQFLLPWALTR